MTVKTGKKLEGYTPGPWRLCAMGENLYIEQDDVCPDFICDVQRKDAPEYERRRIEANAALIAQAPALLEQRDKLVEALRVLYVQVGLVVTDTDMAELLAPASEEAERVLREVDE